jgi:YesN/AraC family two-component response regulator
MLPGIRDCFSKPDGIPVQKSSENKIDEKLLQKVLDYMETSKPYHDSELTLTSLASQMNINRNQLSEIINTGTGGNFYDFINKYRVDEVKQLIENPKFKDYTMLAIAFEAGFASKSTFNSIFRKATGLTPTEYKEKLKSDNIELRSTFSNGVRKL